LQHNNYIDISPSRLSEFERFIPKNKNFNLIEFGPGSGKTLLEIKKKYPHSILKGYDKYPYQGQTLLDINFFDLDSSLIKIKKNLLKADFLIFNDIIEHLYDPLNFVENLSKFTKSGATVIVSCPNFKSIRFLKAWINGECPKEQSGFFDKTHLHWFNREQLESYFNNHGFMTLDKRYLSSKKLFFNSFQKIMPSRLSSQFQLVFKK